MLNTYSRHHRHEAIWIRQSHVRMPKKTAEKFLSLKFLFVSKEQRNCISRIIRVWSLFCSMRVYTSLHFLPILLENYFGLSELFVFCLFCVEFDVNFLTLHNRCLHSNRCQVLCAFVLTYLKQFVKTDTRQKNLSIFLNKNMPLEGFWVLKVPFIKENVEHSNWKRKKTLSTYLRRRNFVVNLWY